MTVLPIIGTRVARRCIGGPYDGRVVQTPPGQDWLKVPNARPPVAMTGPATAQKLLDDSTRYELCILRFPDARIEVWHPVGTAIVATVARMASGYVPEADLRLIMAKVALLEDDKATLRAALDARMPGVVGQDVVGEVTKLDG
jgi:hypothetical protein